MTVQVSDGPVQKTEVLEQTTSGALNSLFSFDVAVRNRSDLEVEKILVQVKDHNKLLANTFIGSHELDLAVVYARPGHELHRQWLALAGPSADGGSGRSVQVSLILSASPTLPPRPMPSLPL